MCIADIEISEEKDIKELYGETPSRSDHNFELQKVWTVFPRVQPTLVWTMNHWG